MATIEITYQDQSCCEAVHATSGQRLKAVVAPGDTTGARVFSPTDLVAAAFGIDLAIRLGQVAESELLDLKGMRIGITREVTDEPTPRIRRLSASVHMPIQLTSGMKATLARAARTCPVTVNLSAEIEIAVQFVFL